MLFATTPPLIAACRKIAVRHPGVRILNCSVSMPYTGVRTYYSRIYEGKFITGAIAGAMAKDDQVGYVASYPIFGVPAGINAFALGARLANPRVKIYLHWSCTPAMPWISSPGREFPSSPTGTFPPQTCPSRIGACTRLDPEAPFSLWPLPTGIGAGSMRK